MQLPNVQQKQADSAAARWFERYQVEGDQLRDLWRGVACVRYTAGSASLPALKALQMSDHPGLQPLLDFWVDEHQCVLIADFVKGMPVRQWLSKHELSVDVARELALRYISILIYGRAMTPACDLHGLEEHLVVLSGEPRLQLIASAHATIVQSREGGAPEAEAVRDAREFAERLGLRVATDCTTLTKLRTALKNAQLQ